MYAFAREMQEEEEEEKRNREKERKKRWKKGRGVYMRGALRSMVRLSRWRNMCF